jgi:tetratricopeptide (TPR) repeat protein
MRLRAAAVVVCLCCLGSDPTSPAPPGNSAMGLWEKGQQAMLDGNADAAMAAYRESLRLDPGLSRNYLSLAAACLEKGQDTRAADFLADYIRRQPDHFLVRLHYADLLVKLGRPKDARAQFQQFIADAQPRPELARDHLIHCHSQLMELAEADSDDYGEHLHRGIGLYLLARQRAELPESAVGLSEEGLLCKAAGELTLAYRARPEEARPCWYLSAVWTELAQRRPAGRWLRSADAAAPFTYLTPSERESLRLACQRAEAETWRR